MKVNSVIGVGFNGKTGHPAVFPQQLATDHILSWSLEGYVVFDPFLGSGTTALSAIRNNRKFIGVEIDKTYFQIAQQRIEEELNNNLTLFNEKDFEN